MATISISSKHMVFTSNNKIVVYDIKSGVEIFCESLSDSKKAFPLPAANTQLELPNDNEEKEGSEENKAKNEGSDRILAVAFSFSGKYFVSSDDRKNLTVWNTEAGWSIIYSRVVPRRATSVLFTKDETEILLADKSGDVHRFKIDSVESDDLVVGHISMLLDLKLCCNDEYLVTCDRDEKIRVSHYPNAYNIQEFCLGHSDFVSRLVYISGEDLLLSGSGDGTVRMWNYKSGIQLDEVDCVSYMEIDPSKKCRCLIPNQLAAEISCRSADIRCMAHSDRFGLVAVSFELRRDILIFKRIRDDRGSQSLKFVCKLAADESVWDVQFSDTLQCLFVLQSLEGATLKIYSIERSSEDFKISPCIDDSAFNSSQTIMSAVNNNVEFFQPSFNMESIFPSLHKVHIDNMSEYVSRKCQRIDQQSKKASKDRVPENNSEPQSTNKRTKLDINN